MGVIPLLRVRRSATSSGDCRLCADMRAPVASPASAMTQLRDFVPLALAATLGLVLAAIDRGTVGSLAAGVAVGIGACAVYVWRGRRSLLRSAHESHADELSALTEDADARVEAVVKQFEWAVGDFAKLRRRLEEAEASAQTLMERGREREHQNEQLVRQISLLRERLAEIAMAASVSQPTKEPVLPAASEAIQVGWGVHFDGPRARLELQTAASSECPTRLRVMDRDGQIVAVSGMAIVSLDGNLEFQVEPPIDLIVDLDEGREINYAIEALVDQEWKPVRLNDTGHRTRSVVDVQGRLSRVRDNSDTAQLSATVDGRRSALN
jgi:hypothetical protein